MDVESLFINWTNLIMILLSIALSFRGIKAWWDEKFSAAEKQRNIALVAGIVVIVEQLIRCLVPDVGGVCVVNDWTAFFFVIAQIVGAAIVANAFHASKNKLLG